jgi:DNA-binding MarR family transcriptional regulator
LRLLDNKILEHKILVNDRYAWNVEDDFVDRLVAQWGPERPDLDLRAMATVARLTNLGSLIDAEIEALAARYGVSRAEGDILFTLRRAGSPYRLAPSRLSDSLLVSSGTLTSRLDRLEAKGLIARIPHPTDRRSMEVALTDRGRELADEAVTIHVGNERKMLAALSDDELETLNGLTRRLLARVASGEWRSDEQ